MTHSECKSCNGMLAFSYLVTLGLAIYFSRGVSGSLHSPWILAVALGVGGAVLGGIFWFLFKGKMEASTGWGALIPFKTFALIQAGLGFAVAKYVFNFAWDDALAFPAGAIVAYFVFFLLMNTSASAWARYLAAGFIASGLVIGLRLNGIFGGLLYALALLNGACLGMAGFKTDEQKHLWGKALVCGAFLAAGRAAIQYYLLQAGYANLGVVVTMPYTFVALFAGFFLPVAMPSLEKERPFPLAILIVLLGILVPLTLGVLIHIRPMSAYLFGLVVSGFAVGILTDASAWVAFVGYLSAATAVLGLPLFRDFANLSRVTRLEVLGGLFLLAIILYFVSPKAKPSAEAVS